MYSETTWENITRGTAEETDVVHVWTHVYTLKPLQG